MSFYEQNLQVLFKKNPKLATKLFSIKENQKFEVFVDEKDPLNINIADILNGDVLYPTIPIDETQKKLDEFVKYQRYPFLYFYGLGNGVFFKALLQNETLRRVVVVEPEIEMIYIAFHFNDFTAEIEQDRLVLLLSQDISSAEAIMIFMLPEAKIFSKTYNLFVTLDYYERYYSDEVLRVNALFIQAIKHVVVGTGNSSVDALIGLKHHIANIDKMLQTPTLMELLKQCKNTQTAVIVSTGPSLKKQLPLLKKIQNYVTILCIDASFPILFKEGIKPDIVFSLERVIDTAKFYEAVSQEFFNDVIFAVTSLVHPDLLKEIKAGELQISMRPFGYTRYFDKPDYGYLGIGMSAANMAYELVFHANFKNCILIGQDLAFGNDGSTHSDGHIYGSTEDNITKDSLGVEAYGGMGSVATTAIWKQFKNFFETDIACANDKGIITINATEGGARIQGSLEMSFEDAIRQFVDTSVSKKTIELRQREISSILSDRADAKSKISDMLAFALQVQTKVKETFLHVMNECELMDKIDPTRLYEEVDFQKLADLMSEIDSIKEYFSQKKFSDIFIDATQALIVHQEIEIAVLQVRDAKTDNEKRQKMIEWVYAHKYWLFSLAGLIQATIDAINMGIEIGLDFDKITTIAVELDGKEIDLLHVNHQDRIINNIYDLKQMCIDYELTDQYASSVQDLEFYYCDDKQSFKSQVYMPARNDAHFNEFAFKNSLETTIDKKQFENLYEKDAVGFLATEESLKDKDFINYIKSLAIDFPQIKLKAFYFNLEQKNQLDDIFKTETFKIECIPLVNIYDFCEHIEVFIFNHNREFVSPLDELIINFLRKYSVDIVSFGTQLLKHQNITVGEFEQKQSTWFKKFFDNLELLGYEKYDLKKYGDTFHEVYFKKSSDTYSIAIDFDLNAPASKILHWNLQIALGNHKFVQDRARFIKRYLTL